MAALTPIPLVAGGATPVAFAAAGASGDTVTIPSGMRCRYIVRNGSGSAVTTTIVGVQACSQGHTHDDLYSCPAGVDTDILVPGACVDAAAGLVTFSYSATASVQVVALIEIDPAGTSNSGLANAAAGLMNNVLTAVSGIYAPLTALPGKVDVTAQGASIGAATLSGDVISLALVTPWSVDANGNVDYSPSNTPPAGYSPAVLGVDSSGNFVVTKIAS